MQKMVIIGANGSAYKRTIPGIFNSSLVKVVAIQSRNIEKMKNTCQEFSINKYYQDINEMLEKEEYDLIYIANPPFLHLDSIKECIKFNKPLICEKPLARNYKEALLIENMLQEYKYPIMIAHHIRHQKAYQDLKKIIDSKEIGDIIHCYLRWSFSINEDAPSSAWKLDKNLGGGGVMSDCGIHAIDFIIGLFGEPKKVVGNSILGTFTESYSNETMILDYDTKDVVINASHKVPVNFSDNNILIYGTNGKIEVYGGLSENSISKIVLINNNGTRTINYQSENLYKNEVEDFVNQYFNETKCNGTSLKEALISLKIIDIARGESK